MQHLKKHLRFNRTASHRKAMIMNLCRALIKNGRIKTTKAKARILRSVAEKLITRAKKNTLPAKRTAAAFLKNWDMIPKLFNEIAPSFKNRPGGYTRMIKLGFRESDSAEEVYLELIRETKKEKASK